MSASWIAKLKESDSRLHKEDVIKQAESYRDVVIPAMQVVREAADGLEMVMDADLWPLPTYAEMLFIK